MKIIAETETEEKLLDYLPYVNELDRYTIERMARTLDAGESVYWAVELGRCPSTDNRTYILHVYYEEPKYDYYGAEYLDLETLMES